ncbi:MAG: sirohydrochlorin chelatase [Methylococcales bacterium]|nr:sirohydrochlorin chelatase [Methylococcales bacterium]
MNTQQTILLVGHGSREASGNLEIERFVKHWRNRFPQQHIEVCFIEFADVLLDQGLDNAAKLGHSVIVIPLILNAAGHVKMELPEHIEQARLRYPLIEFIFCRHLGASEEILTILKRTLKKAMAKLDVPDPRTTGIVILGRGSSDRVANGEIAKMARWLFEEGDHDLVDIAFTGITHPRLESSVQRQVKLEMKQIIILPYYLFTGTLMERIYRQVERLQTQYPQIHFALGDYMGFEDEVYELLEKRINEATDIHDAQMMECDGCKYREIAAEHGHGHNHDHDRNHDHSEGKCT